MAQLVLTLAGSDRAGLVQALADLIAAHEGNWERSELSELAGVFAGIVLVSVPDERAEALTAALNELEGMLRVTAHAAAASGGDGERFVFIVLGNDRPGIVRDVTAAVSAHALSIDDFRSRTLEAPMAGGTLFEATVTVRMPQGGDSAAIVAELERLADEIQVDLSIAT